jgi:uncharacterized protein (TIGR03000 family)
MFRKIFTYGGTLLISGAVILATPSLGLSQRGGGHMGGFSGGHMGNFNSGHVGGFNGFHGDFSHNPGSRNFHNGSFIHTPNHFDNRFNGRNFFDHRFGYWGGYYPYFGFYGSPSYGFYSDSPSYSADTYIPPSYGDGPITSAPSIGSFQSYYVPPVDNRAHITVQLPADGKITVQDKLMSTTGAVQQFDSPLLEPGYRYSYDIQATWTENGKEVTQKQQVEVAPGATVQVYFRSGDKSTVKTTEPEKTPSPEKK